MRSAFGAGSLDGIELESLLGEEVLGEEVLGVDVSVLGAVFVVEPLGAALESVELGLVELEGWFDIVDDDCGVVL